MGQLYIGLMSGTSLDGVDVAIVDFDNDNPSLISTFFKPYPQDLLTQLKKICGQTQVGFDELGSLDSQLGSFYAQCVNQSLSNAGLDSSDIVAIGSHGQTIHHSPNTSPAHTLQIGDANRIAEESGIAVVTDFRRRDIAVGGQGAPLVPAFHKVTFQSPTDNLVILNIGGISNVTFLDKNINSPMIGFDCGPGNTLMNQWCQLHFDVSFDKSGALAKAGQLNNNLLVSLLADPYFSLPYPKSTGPEYFNIDWLHLHLDKHPTNINDTLRTLCEFSAACIVLSIGLLPSVDQTLVCGGGVHNDFLMRRLADLCSCPVTSTETYGVAPDWVEAMAFAWLAKQTVEGKPGNTPSVTGANKAVVLGAIYPA
ncbi:MAG: anhydro-N-acetylmuramic acid kinase [Porticoccaceae bacterium]|nr:anhydro-N-acetylmuramic acid kinase [Porticoccaceae bacterium]